MLRQQWQPTCRPTVAPFPIRGWIHVKGVSVAVLGGKGQASESCKSQKGTSLKVRQSWRLEEPSKRCERVGGSTEKAPMDARFRGQTLLFLRKLH